MTDRALELHIPKKGPAEVLTAREVTLPAPRAGEVRVAIEATGVAYADIMMRRGVYPNTPPPVTPGYDFVGRVEALGPDVSGLGVGQRVGAVTVTGSYATRRNVDARWLVPAPENVDAAKLVAAILNGLTAWQMFHRIATPEKGEWVLVHGAAGGVGSLLLDLARLAGARAIGTASTAKRDVVTARGGDYVDYTTEDVVERARALSDGGVVAAFDHLGGNHFTKRSVAALRGGGVGILYGGYDVTRDGGFHPFAALDLLLRGKFSSYELFSKSKGVVGYSVVAWRDARIEIYRKDLARIFELIAEGTLSPLIGGTFPLKEAAKAQRALESRSVAGKLVLLTQ